VIGDYATKEPAAARIAFVQPQAAAIAMFS